MPSNKVQINDAQVWEVPDSYMEDLEIYLGNVGTPGMPDDGKAEASTKDFPFKPGPHFCGVPEPPDVWAHRSTGMRCKTCMFFVPKMASIYARPIGRCRRHAPTMSGYPAVYPDDWCGEHKVDETKLGGPVDKQAAGEKTEALVNEYLDKEPGVSMPSADEVRMPLAEFNRLTRDDPPRDAVAEFNKVEADEADYGRAELDKMKAEARLLNAQARGLELQNERDTPPRQR